METGFIKYHPLSNLIYFLSILFFALTFKHPATIAACFLSVTTYYIMLCRKEAVKSVVCFFLPMVLFIVIINALFSHYGITPLYTLKSGNQITLESIVYGFILGVITVSIIMLFYCYNKIMTTDKFLHIFGRFLPTFALVISMTLRYIPLIKKRLKEINDAQTNFNSAKDNLFNKIKSALRNISILITWSLEKAIETADSMKSRGYGLKNRTNYSKYKLKKKDFVFIVTIVAIDLILIISLFKKSIYCFYNPYIMISRHTMFSAVSIVCFTILCFLPIFTDIKEELKWIRLKSKI